MPHKIEQDYEKSFDDNWKSIIISEDGSVNLDQVKRELHDYLNLMTNASKVYEHFAGLSKTNYEAHVIIEEGDRRESERVQECIIEFIKDNYPTLEEVNELAKCYA